MAYQSFKKGAGSSNSTAKLEALNLPDLKGKSFLDLGCNAGFFCNHALEQGASRVVGVEKAKKYIEPARAQMPDAEFISSDWSDFQTDEKFDVIINLSAFHYAKDPSALLRKIHDMLTPNGVFVFEGGVVQQNLYALWIPVTRGVGTVWYPTRKLWESVLLKDFSFRYIGPSVTQKGDALPRVVYHCQRRMRSWTLVSGKRNEGKSTYASTISADNLVELDWMMRTIFTATMFKGDPIVDEFCKLMKKTRHLGDTVRWINTDQRAAAIANHIIQYMPKECDLVIEGFLLSNDLFMKHFQIAAKALGVRLWHSQKIS